ncbi:TetR/AcrR family transcriptional regulator [Saccharopolyspora griseoalba]|uniref:TetR/AcrR family transcriptional regulator n=1 Tax=Saccharopolyspora griseoalba TaxID=1431848 RepID=A0ABW2LRT2_9PSEU
MAGSRTGSGGGRSPAAERILTVASQLFYEKGIRAVGVNAIADRAQVTKVTLYAHFGSKDGLVAAHLRSRDARWQAELGERLAAAGAPGERLAAIFDAYQAWAVADDFRGCGFVNAAAELADLDHPARAVISEHKASVAAQLEDAAAAAGCPSPGEVAEECLLLLEGAAVTAALRRDTEPLQRARRAALRLLPSSN